MRGENVNKRICPDELELSAYYCGKLNAEERLGIEAHLVKCNACRKLVAETHEVLASRTRFDIFKRVAGHIKKNIWLYGAVAAFALSFIIPKHFLQFLAIALLMGIKWIIDSKTTKMLITVYDALRHPSKEPSEKNAYHNNKAER